jgi:hypothetical protein
MFKADKPADQGIVARVSTLRMVSGEKPIQLELRLHRQTVVVRQSNS